MIKNIRLQISAFRKLQHKTAKIGHTKYIFEVCDINPVTFISLLAGSEKSMRASDLSTSYRRRP